MEQTLRVCVYIAELRHWRRRGNRNYEFDETPVLSPALTRLRAWQVASLAFRVGPTDSFCSGLQYDMLFDVIFHRIEVCNLCKSSALTRE